MQKIKLAVYKSIAAGFLKTVLKQAVALLLKVNGLVKPGCKTIARYIHFSVYLTAPAF